jgi:2-oxoisovalerate dehydrogenase E2 component (dihydrolipoyl transacylase)
MPSIVMPQPGQSVTEGTVVKWLKQVGDHVAADEVIVEIETEKVNVELPSPFDGTLTEILVPEGETVPVGADLAIVEVAGAAPTSEPAIAEPPAVAVEPTGDGSQPAPIAREPAAPAAVAAHPAETRRNGAESNGAATRYSPAVLRLAAEHNLDLSQIHGTGMGGRVTRKDVAQFIERGPQVTAATATPPAPAIAATASGAAEAGITEERELAESFTEAPPRTVAAQAPAVRPQVAGVPVAGEDEEVIRPSPTRLTIARNMLRTAQTVPTAWMAVEVDVTGLVRLRGQQREAFREREGVELTYLPFIAQAVTAALREHPMLNSEWRDDQIVVKRRINLGVAVGVEDGLIVPVIHNADRLSLSGLTHAINDLATRARAKKLKIEDVTGGTFTIDNTGVFGSLVSQPIINPPQAAILSTEAIIKRPVVLDDSIAVRSMMNLCISFDHRIIDGSHAGPFMQGIKRRLESLTADNELTGL